MRRQTQGVDAKPIIAPEPFETSKTANVFSDLNDADLASLKEAGRPPLELNQISEKLKTLQPIRHPMNLRLQMLGQFKQTLSQLLHCIRVSDAAAIELQIESIGPVPTDKWVTLKATQLEQYTRRFGGTVLVAMFSGLALMGLLFMLPMSKGLSAAARNSCTASAVKQTVRKIETMVLIAAAVVTALVLTELRHSAMF